MTRRAGYLVIRIVGAFVAAAFVLLFVSSLLRGCGKETVIIGGIKYFKEDCQCLELNPLPQRYTHTTSGLYNTPVTVFVVEDGEVFASDGWFLPKKGWYVKVADKSKIFRVGVPYVLGPFEDCPLPR